MKKINKVIILVVVVAALIIAYWLVSPIFIDKRVSEGLEEIIMKEEIAVDEEDGVGKEVEVGEESKIELAVVSSGIFTGLEGHEASGTAQIIQSDGKYYVRFEEDFESTNGPDVHVYLGKDNEYAPETDMGLIKGNIGSQNYEVPKGVNVFDYN